MIRQAHDSTGSSTANLTSQTFLAVNYPVMQEKMIFCVQ